MYFRLFIKGPAKSGKTALLARTLFDMRLLAGGYVVLPLVSNGESRALGMLEPCEAAAATMPYGVFADAEIGGAQSVNEERFIKKCAAAYDEILEKNMGLLDEVGGAELKDSELTAKLAELISSPVPLAGALCPRESAGDKEAYNALLATLENDEQTLILDITQKSSLELAAVIREWAEGVFDWAHHQKFDPLERPRFKTARRK